MKTLVAHLGSHKTATTHFQDTLALMSEELMCNGVKYLSRDFFRPLIPRAMLTGKKHRFRRLLPEGLNTRHLERFYEELAAGADTLFISDENIIGSAYELLNDCLYPKFESRTAFLKTIACKHPVEILVSIRCFDKVLPGAYVTDLKFFPEKAKANKQAVIKQIADGIIPSWIDFVNRVTAQFSGVKPLIWTQEFYSSHSADIIHRVIKDYSCNIPHLNPPEETVTPSFEAIDVIEKTNPGRIKDWTTYCDTIYRQYPARTRDEKYTFLSKQMQEDLKEQYAIDLSTLARDSSVEFLG